MTYDIEAMMRAKGAKVLSIRAPSEDETWSDPRGKDQDKWAVAYKTNNLHYDWVRGKPKATLQAALEAALGPMPKKPSTDLADILA